MSIDHSPHFIDQSSPLLLDDRIYRTHRGRFWWVLKAYTTNRNTVFVELTGDPRTSAWQVTATARDVAVAATAFRKSKCKPAYHVLEAIAEDVTDQVRIDDLPLTFDPRKQGR